MRTFIRILIPALFALPLLAFADGDADKSVSQRKKDVQATRAETPTGPRGKKSATRPAPPITSEQESAALTLVREHHNDLLELLIYLEEKLPKEYERAIRDLSRASDRLAAYKKRDPKRYEMELALWQAQSQRQLLTARLQMGQDEGLLTEIRATLVEEHRLSVAILRHEHERLTSRLAKVSEQIETQSASADSLVEKKFAALKKVAQISERSVSKKKRKSAPTKKSKDPA